MTPQEFLSIRKKLNKSQKSLSQLLSVSLKSTQNYETGKCPIPHYVERMLFFFVARIKNNPNPKVPCWVVKNCPPDRKLKCPAWEFQAGSFCWFINGTLCQCTDQSSWDKKIKICRQCQVLMSHGIGEERELESEKGHFKDQIDSVGRFGQIIGKDNKMQLIYNLIQDIADTNSSVVLKGDAGTGKEFIAHAIHQNSHRASHPYVIAHCSAYSDQLLEAELFGYEKDAFPGALKRKIGRLEQADNGTIVLKDVDKISSATQVKLSHVLKKKELKRMGGDKVIQVDVRVIATTHKDLLEESQLGRFREDFFNQINVIPITVPPLCERRNDIPLLASYFLTRFSSEQGKEIKGFDSDAMRTMINYSWPGNVREFENCVEQSVVLTSNGLISVDNLPLIKIENQAKVSPGLSGSIPENEKNLLVNILDEHNGNKKKTAELLGISRSTLYAKLRKYNIE